VDERYRAGAARSVAAAVTRANGMSEAVEVVKGFVGGCCW
jgi:hypothetical protein